ncbi:MAG: hypothetical protein AAF213_07340 [Pseudomonadota bacterium]
MRSPKPKEYEPVEEKGFLVELRRNWLFLAIILCVAVGAYVMFKPEPPPPPPTNISAVWQSPDRPQVIRNFGVMNRAGTVNNIEDYYGRPKIIIGYQLECEACIRSLQTLDEIVPLLRTRVDILTMAIATRSGSLAELIQKEFDENNIVNLRPYTIGSDVSEGLFNTNVLPHAFILDSNNFIIRVSNGGANWNDPALFDLIDQLAGQEQ